jgi:pimeloyl-ACP methyl ester carboxylesterase
MSEGFLTINGLRLRYLEWGDPNAPPMLLLHGFSSTAQAWQKVGDVLASRYHVVALDQRGHGASDWDAQGRYTIDDFVADAHAVAQQLKLQPFVLVGHSMGGAIAYTYAAVYPSDVTRLVIEDSAPRPADDPRPPLQPMQAPVYATRADVAASIREANPKMTDEVVEQRVDVYYIQRPDGTWGYRADVAGVRAALASQPRNEKLWQLVRTIQCPTLVIRAGQEPPGITPVTVDLLKQANPRIEVVTVADAGHDIHFAHFDEFMAVLEQFLPAPEAGKVQVS